MANLNTVTVIGNTTRDAELKFTSGGTAVAEVGLAVNRRWKKKDSDEFEEKVSFFDVVCWKQLGENVAESIPKGTRVVVVGRLEQDSWENEAGEKRSKVRIIADVVAPSLEWATVEVTKNPKSGGGGDDGAPEPVEDF